MSEETEPAYDIRYDHDIAQDFFIAVYVDRCDQWTGDGERDRPTGRQAMDNIRAQAKAEALREFRQHLERDSSGRSLIREAVLTDLEGTALRIEQEHRDEWN